MKSLPEQQLALIYQFIWHNNYIPFIETQYKDCVTKLEEIINKPMNTAATSYF